MNKKRFYYSAVTFVVLAIYCGFEYWNQSGFSQYFKTLLTALFTSEQTASIKWPVDVNIAIDSLSAMFVFSIIWTPLYWMGLLLIKLDLTEELLEQDSRLSLIRNQKIRTTFISIAMIINIGLCLVVIFKPTTAILVAVILMIGVILSVGFLLGALIIALRDRSNRKLDKLSTRQRNIKNSLSLIISSLILAAMLPYIHGKFIELETEGGEMRVDRISYFLYTTFGKEGVMWGLGSLTVIFFTLGLIKFFKTKKQTVNAV